MHRLVSQVVEQSPNPILITDLNCHIEYVNDAFISYVGYTPEEVLGKTPNIFKSGKTPSDTYQTMWQALLSGNIWQGEFINRISDGEEKIEAATIIPLRQTDGQITQYAAIKEDITIRKTQEAELRKLFMAVEQSPESIVITDLEVRIEYVNQSFMNATGYRREEVLGQNPRILQSGHTQKAVYDEMWAKLSKGEAWRGELINRRKNGEEYIEFAHIAPVREPDGRITHYLAIKEDITEKKRLNDELEHYRGHLEELVAIRTDELYTAIREQNALFEVASAGIVLLCERRIVRCNRYLNKLFGYTHEELIGKSTCIWYNTEKEFQNIGEMIYSNLANGQIDIREVQFKRKNGTLFWCRVSSRAINPEDLRLGVVVILDDITDEHAIREELRGAQVLAEAAAQMKSDFLANMSHEIRTPMNVIIGMAHLMFKTNLTPSQHDYLKKIHNSSQHLLGIINDILDLSKIEAGKMTIEKIEFNLDDVLENVAGLMNERVTSKGLEFIIDVDRHVPRGLIGDPLRIGQILINYCNNAVKFTNQGEIIIRIRVADEFPSPGLADGEKFPPSGGLRGDVLLHCAVTDTGIGISAEQRERLFQNFEQADTSTTRKYGGTGLGLAISKRLAELMSGTVGVDSKLGEGSTFWFIARLERGENDIQAFLPEPDLRGRRVLVVDDHKHSREILTEQLESMTFVTNAVASGQEALAELVRAQDAGQPYEIVFLDWQMPGMNGIATAARIGELALTPSPKAAPCKKTTTD